MAQIFLHHTFAGIGRVLGKPHCKHTYPERPCAMKRDHIAILTTAYGKPPHGGRLQPMRLHNAITAGVAVRMLARRMDCGKPPAVGSPKPAQVRAKLWRSWVTPHCPRLSGILKMPIKLFWRNARGRAGAAAKQQHFPNHFSVWENSQRMKENQHGMIRLALLRCARASLGVHTGLLSLLKHRDNPILTATCVYRCPDRSIGHLLTRRHQERQPFFA